MRAEQLTDPVTYHGEGAVWSDLWGGLKWVDMLAGDVLSLDPEDGAVSRMPVGSPVAAVVRPRRNGGLLVATEREFTLWRRNSEGDDGLPFTQEFATPPLWPGRLSRFNDGGCDPEGRMLCGAMAYSADEGSGVMYRMNVDGSTDELWRDVTISNGLGFTASGTRMYYIDSPTNRVDVFDVGAGSSLSGRRPFVRIPEGAGTPDGLWVDALDGVWVALYGGSAVHHYDASGSLADVIELPVSKVTSCCLGGPTGTTLYITTSRENLAAGAEPLAGSLFTASVGVAGVAALPFAG
ncbi:gluconolactonase [Subtercola sp. Z020]|uniref:SMP-30/gluconolactonase/LRE family protein n=1 Tax=Subtercola sp. Z020 TaxID=2080582 RepID=UPI000CE72252|nr:SMP-30/gluconolactonase/LRE family protein [Subtercola sp. Z020]PPF77085.1 gluconolactonase [Subtercola sp. Z020]